MYYKYFDIWIKLYIFVYIKKTYNYAKIKT